MNAQDAIVVHRIERQANVKKIKIKMWSLFCLFISHTQHFCLPEDHDDSMDASTCKPSVRSEIVGDVDCREDESVSTRELGLPDNTAVCLEKEAGTSDDLGTRTKAGEEQDSVKPKGIKLRKSKDGKVSYCRKDVTRKSKEHEANAVETAKDPSVPVSGTDSQVIMNSYILIEGEDDVKLEAEAKLGKSAKEANTKEKQISKQHKPSLLTSLKDVEVQCATFIPRKSWSNECLSEELTQEDTWVDDSYPRLSGEGIESRMQHNISAVDSTNTDTEAVVAIEAKEEDESGCTVKTEDEDPRDVIHGDGQTWTVGFSKNIALAAENGSVESNKTPSKVNDKAFGDEIVQTPARTRNDAKDPTKGSDARPEFMREKQPNTVTSGRTVTSCTATKDSEIDDSLEDFQVPKRTGTPVAVIQGNAEGKKTNSNRKKGRRARQNKNLKRTSWSCSACTFLNERQMIECSICFTPKRSVTEMAANETDGASSSQTPHSGENSPMDTSDNLDFEKSIKMSHQRDTIERDGGRPVNGTRRPSQEAPSLETSENNFSTECSIGGDDKEDVFVTTKERPSWSCTACTFMNHWQLIECSICFTPRRRSQRQSKSEWSTPAVERRRGQDKKSRFVKNVLGHFQADESVTPLKDSKTLPHVDETLCTPSTSTLISTCGVSEDHGGASDREKCPSQDIDSPSFSNRVSTPLSESLSLDKNRKLPELPNKSLPNQRPKKRLRLENIEAGTVSPVEIFQFSSDDGSDCEMLESCSSGMDSIVSSSVDRSKEDSSTYESVEELAVAEELFSNSDLEDDVFWWNEDECLRDTVESDNTSSPALSSSRSDNSCFKKCSELFSVNELHTKLQQDSGLPTSTKDTEQSSWSEDLDVFENSWDFELLEDSGSKKCDSKAEQNVATTSTEASVQDEIDDKADLPLEEETPELPPAPMKLKFILSSYTDRVYL